jgi:predicted phage terminase large subunit-like protein
VNNTISFSKIKKYIINDASVRGEIARRSHFGFFCIYLANYIKYPTAHFQRQIFNLCQDGNIKATAITAFRGSGKSTIASLSYPIWAMIRQSKKFIVILSQNQSQCELILANIRSELEKNELLMADFGPFRQVAVSSKWSAETLYVESYDCMITCVSSGSSIRGIRHKQHRPDLIIADDVEDISSTKSKESRDKTFNWFTGEVIPTGDSDTKIIVIGNKLHEDCLMMRLKNAIEDKTFSATYMEFPLVDCQGKCIWPEKFSSAYDIESLKVSVVSELSWQREYLLKIVPQDDAVILREWIQYYDNLPEDSSKLSYIATGVDLAISTSSKADYTAMVSANVYGNDSSLEIYILPHPVNKRMTYPETLETIKNLSVSLGYGYPTKIFIEEVSYQKALIEQLVSDRYPAVGVKVAGQDKRERLTLTTHLIKSGKIKFAKKGCEALISQLTSFGYEAHDDLADAFAILILKIMESSLKPRPKIGRIRVINMPSPTKNYRIRWI